MADRYGRPQSEVLEMFTDEEWIELIALNNIRVDELDKVRKKNSKKGKGGGKPQAKPKGRRAKRGRSRRK